jgi:CubicO group peptidase (beta-lactamase class C family)
MRPLAALLSLAISLSALAQPSFDTRSVDQLMLKTMKAWQIPGAAIAIVKSDRVIYLQGYGTKEPGGTDPVTPETLFQIASTSKAFTSASLAMLATDKKLTFDDPVRKHVEYFRLADPCADANVTLRDIVSHRTGLSRHDELWDDTPLTREDVVRSIGTVELSKPFRTTYQYQNIMFIAAGEVVTHASGMAWDDFVRTRIFQPLNMTHTVTSDADWNAADHASGYRYDWKTVASRRSVPSTRRRSARAARSSRPRATWATGSASSSATGRSTASSWSIPSSCRKRRRRRR